MFLQFALLYECISSLDISLSHLRMQVTLNDSPVASAVPISARIDQASHTLQSKFPPLLTYCVARRQFPLRRPIFASLSVALFLYMMTLLLTISLQSYSLGPLCDAPVPRSPSRAVNVVACSL